MLNEAPLTLLQGKLQCRYSIEYYNSLYEKYLNYFCVFKVVLDGH